jgi:hypothetical protein
MLNFTREMGIIYFRAHGVVGFIQAARTYDLRGEETSIEELDAGFEIPGLQVELGAAKKRKDFVEAQKIQSKIQELEGMAQDAQNRRRR